MNSNTLRKRAAILLDTVTRGLRLVCKGNAGCTSLIVSKRMTTRLAGWVEGGGAADLNLVNFTSHLQLLSTSNARGAF